MGGKRMADGMYAPFFGYACFGFGFFNNFFYTAAGVLRPILPLWYYHQQLQSNLLSFPSKKWQICDNTYFWLTRQLTPFLTLFCYGAPCFWFCWVPSKMSYTQPNLPTTQPNLPTTQWRVLVLTAILLLPAIWNL